ncbi:hypothetical protein ACI48D_17150 [Massilia sp. LXY-6]|uniref:hypothetical protein n=1 Tax=Massilia sp. LXY-6 TaxID=3379823 RepID=UPI003EDEB3D1
MSPAPIAELSPLERTHSPLLLVLPIQSTKQAISLIVIFGAISLLLFAVLWMTDRHGNP